MSLPAALSMPPSRQVSFRQHRTCGCPPSCGTWTAPCQRLDSRTLLCPAFLQVGVNVPLIVRLEGTNVKAGKEILKQLPVVIAADDLDDAAMKAVNSLK